MTYQPTTTDLEQLVEQPRPSRYPFEFRGTAGEYFRIWIVNLALSIVTLGIYSAWATVRTRRYFYGSTEVAGTPFEYHARPVPILIGRAIAVALLGFITLTGFFAPLLEPVMFVGVALLVPVLVVKSLRFRARYSVWRGVHFRFVGTYGQAFVRFALAYLLVIVSLGIAYPWVQARQKEFVVGGHIFGGKRFTIGSLTSTFYGIYIVAVAAAIGLGIVMTLMIMGMSASAGEASIIALILLSYIFMFTIGMYVHSRVINAVYTHTRIGGLGFESRLRARDLGWIYISNTLVIGLTLGLAIPWAKVRMARYRASRLALVGSGDLSAFVVEAKEEERAIGAEIGAAFDVEIGV